MFHIFEELRANVDSTFNNIIYPILLKNNPDDHIDESLPSNQDTAAAPKDKLYNTFLYSLAVLYSRSHEGYDEGDDSSGELVPIVELMNGHSDRIDEVIKKGKKSEKSVITVKNAIPPNLCTMMEVRQNWWLTGGFSCGDPWDNRNCNFLNLGRTQQSRNTICYLG